MGAKLLLIDSFWPSQNLLQMNEAYPHRREIVVNRKSGTKGGEILRPKRLPNRPLGLDPDVSRHWSTSWCRNRDRGICTHHQAGQQGEAEGTHARSAFKEQDQHREQGRSRGEQGPAQGLIDGSIDDLRVAMRRRPRFSRIRSRITMVSFNEYPMMVNRPATTPRSMR